jgi:tetratricopeptide (TPR) repeat protein
MQITSALRGMNDQELARAIRRLAILLVVVAIAFLAFYTLDRWRTPAPGIVDQRIASLEQGVRDNPNEVAKRGQLADAYLEKRRFADALTQYDIVLATGQDVELAQFGRARALVGLDRLDEAAVAYQAVVDIAVVGEMAMVDPMLEAAYYGLGSVAMQQARTADAVDFLVKALAINRSDADALYLIGTAYTAAGQPDLAIDALNRAIMFVPIGWSEPYTALADAYTAGGRPQLAAWATAMADLNSGRADRAETALKGLVEGEAALQASIGLGVLYEARGEMATAAGWYAKALLLDPANDAARLGLTRTGPAPSAADGSNS